VTLQQVSDFLAIVLNGSLHAAARSTGQTQPALTKSLTRLERDLGTPLFTRTSQGVTLNDFGKRFLVHARRVSIEADLAQTAIAQLLGECVGRVEYGIAMAASLLLAPAAIKRFRNGYPDVELRCHSGLYHSLVGPLRNGEIDFAICPEPSGPSDPRLTMRTLLESQMVCVARRGHPLASAGTIAALRDATFTVSAAPGQPGGGVYELFKCAGLGMPRIALHTNGLMDTVAFIAGSDSFALLPAALMQAGLLHERLVAVPLRETLPSYVVGLFQRSSVPLTPAADELATQFMREAAYLK
jgi:DNA-binding transcriptional LysR family regulator